VKSGVAGTSPYVLNIYEMSPQAHVCHIKESLDMSRPRSVLGSHLPYRPVQFELLLAPPLSVPIITNIRGFGTASSWTVGMPYFPAYIWLVRAFSVMSLVSGKRIAATRHPTGCSQSRQSGD